MKNRNKHWFAYISPHISIIILNINGLRIDIDTMELLKMTQLNASTRNSFQI